MALPLVWLWGGPHARLGHDGLWKTSHGTARSRRGPSNFYNNLLARAFQGPGRTTVIPPKGSTLCDCPGLRLLQVSLPPNIAAPRTKLSTHKLLGGTLKPYPHHDTHEKT